ncbi:Asparaginyl-tRNA synthetase, cytoplasmic (Asparagine--tRNA ligase) (AsnRS), partial [Blomia tropicalis]
QGFASTTSFLKRRFSSGDLSGEGCDDQEYIANSENVFTQPNESAVSNVAAVPTATEQAPGMVLNLKGSNTTSAPTSPHKGVSSFLSRATSLTGSVTNTVQQIARVTSQAAAAIKDRYKILLVIDDHLIDWSKYFRGKRLIGDWDIKVEQAEFKDIILTSNSELGTLVSIQTIDRNGVKIARTFRPDFLLVRQHVRDGNSDYSDIIVGLKYGLVASLNSLQSIYNFQDKAWVFANLLAIQHKLGKENFPLIEQTFYPANKELSQIPKFPCVIKIGQSNNGLGKIKVENLQQYQDIRSVLMVTPNYCTIEPFIDSKCDLQIQKIGTNYKAFTRKSVSGNWKANVGSSLLEQIPVNEKLKKWIDDISETFGGLEICSIEAVVCGSTLSLLGESQEEDRRNITELIVQRMNMLCMKNTLIKQQSRTSISSRGEADQMDPAKRQGQRASITSLSSGPPPPIPSVPPPVKQPPMKPPPPISPSTLPPINPNKPQIAMRRNSKEMANEPNSKVQFSETNPFVTSEPLKPITDNPKETSNADVSSRPVLTKRDSQSTIDDIKDEVDDTMRNLRKTFAGIFGDM